MYQKIKKNKQKPIQYQNLNPFKETEKKYKFYADIQTDFSELIDVNNLNEQQMEQQGIHKNGSIYHFDYPQGVIQVKNFLNLDDQIRISKLCMNEYINQPYRTNLFIYKEDENFDKFIVHDNKRYHFNNKIRWANVGYQYDWNNRHYPQEKTQVPDPIQEISQRANNFLKLQNHYQSESVIINFYQTHDYMTGHLDDAELDQVSPIYSFSFGLSSVFVIGGPTKDEKPIALKLDSGDLLVMSGHARRCYHGVPRILANSFHPKQNPFQQQQLDGNLNTDFHVFNYLSEHRININTRQVYKPQLEQ
ncbi:unnamed protein product [Paramecium pentaurelia]|uniref:Fe2OG dioxygenase domain-containing protein n=1 Tax=Paramecium pentaurelia TaxID=43138 RepID=A0A8S1X1Z1_9CILI|nr:unnamed protein product [Paramecium pentaurelia]